MKKKNVNLPIFVLVIFILLVSIGCDSTQQEDVEAIIDEKLEAIVSNSNVAASSNPYDYVKGNEDYEYIVDQGDKALKYLLQKFDSTNENGLTEYVMAVICSEILGENQENRTWSSGREWYESHLSGETEQGDGLDIEGRIVDVYIAALDSLVNLDEGLNGGMKYISIDTSTLKHLRESNKSELLKYFQNYDVEVMDASFDELKEKGLFNEETLSLEGILLSIDDIKMASDKKIIIEGSKYRSGLGAIGVNCILEYKGDQWEVKKAEITWIS